MSDIQKLKDLIAKYHEVTKKKGYDEGGEATPKPSNSPALDPKKVQEFQKGFNSGGPNLTQSISNVKKALGFADGGLVSSAPQKQNSSPLGSELEQILDEAKSNESDENHPATPENLVPTPNGGLTGKDLEDYIKQNPGPPATTGFNPNNPGTDKEEAESIPDAPIKGPKIASVKNDDNKLSLSLPSEKGPSLLDNTNPSPDDSKSAVAGMLSSLNSAAKPTNPDPYGDAGAQALKDAQAHDKLVGGIAGALFGPQAIQNIQQHGNVAQIQQQRTAQDEATKHSLAQYQLADEKEKNDANSAASTLARNVLQSSAKMAGLQLGDISKLSASTIEKNFPSVAHLIDTQAQAQQRAEAAKDRLALLQTQLGNKQNDKQNQAMQQTQQLLESARGNPAAAQAERDIYASQKLNSLVSQGNLNPQMVQLAASEIAKIAQGGVPNSAELKGLQPNTIPSHLAELAQKVSNHPVGADAQEFLKQYKQYADTITKDAQNVIHNKYGRIIETKKGTLTPDNYKALQDNYLNRFSPQKRTPESSGGSDEMVNVISPEGKPGTIPKANLQKALARGFKEQVR